MKYVTYSVHHEPGRDGYPRPIVDFQLAIEVEPWISSFDTTIPSHVMFGRIFFLEGEKKYCTRVISSSVHRTRIKIPTSTPIMPPPSTLGMQTKPGSHDIRIRIRGAAVDVRPAMAAQRRQGRKGMIDWVFEVTASSEKNVEPELEKK